jgi:hypothetical protein
VFHLPLSTTDDFYLGDNIEQILALLRFSEYDANMYYALSDSVTACLNTSKQPPLPDHLHAELVRALLRVWRAYYHHPANEDVPFEVATALLSLDEVHAALPVFRFSLSHFGADHATLQNLVTCCELLSLCAEGVRYCERCIAIQPDDVDMRERLAALHKRTLRSRG